MNNFAKKGKAKESPICSILHFIAIISTQPALCPYMNIICATKPDADLRAGSGIAHVCSPRLGADFTYFWGEETRWRKRTFPEASNAMGDAR